MKCVDAIDFVAMEILNTINVAVDVPSIMIDIE